MGSRKPRPRPCQGWSLSQHSSESREIPSCSRPLGDDGAGGTGRGHTAGPSLLPFLVEKDAESEAIKKSQIHPRRHQSAEQPPPHQGCAGEAQGHQQPNFGVKI